MYEEGRFCRDDIEFLEAKVSHFKARKQICKSQFFTALKACFSEVVNGNYVSYGTIKSLPFDLMTRLIVKSGNKKQKSF